MKAFRRKGTSFRAEFEPVEASMLASLAGQVAELVEARSGNEQDPAVLRLLPDAYPGDVEASDEFRRFTADGLAERKVANAGVLAASVAEAAAATSATRVLIDAQQAQAWVRALTDIRLTVAARLGIEKDEDVGADDPLLRDLYDWLGFVQGSLVEVMG
ncbi:DUF2017 domain-containing protein [Glaciihabitans sp. UYNi722]|uniref:DUF2017 domain-containing protein n=1 Tax=Glaciihabitans sp. UYNi722 TaxID=3156344 RepID=UPI0033980CD1